MSITIEQGYRQHTHVRNIFFAIAEKTGLLGMRKIKRDAKASGQNNGAAQARYLVFNS